jgi:hypothetical protein
VKTYYDTLQVSRVASPIVIKAAYRGLSQKNHPDKNPANLVQATEDMRRLNEAYAVLGDEVRRARYDEDLFIKEMELSKNHSAKSHRDTSKQSTKSNKKPPRYAARSADNKGSSQAKREKDELKSRFNNPESYGQHVSFVPVDAISQRSLPSRIPSWLPPLALIFLLVCFNWFHGERPGPPARLPTLATPADRIPDYPAPGIAQTPTAEAPTFTPQESKFSDLNQRTSSIGNSNAHLLIPDTGGTNLSWPFGRSPSAGPNCVYKGVMADQDYRNCGIEPPR